LVYGFHPHEASNPFQVAGAWGTTNRFAKT
jgi:hypothetical protein